MVMAGWIIGTVAICYFIIRKERYSADRITNVIGTLLAVTVLTFFIAGMDWAVSEAHGPVVYHNHAIQAITTNSETSGQFFLASGGFGEHAKYYYYGAHNGGFKMYSVDAEDATIIQDAPAGTAYVSEPCQSNKLARWPIYPLNWGQSNDMYECKSSTSNIVDGDFLFHVPPNSIAYNVDLSLPKG